VPNFDAGHYFLTVLAPIRADSVIKDDQSHSYRHLLREALDRMPTGERTVASVGMPVIAPFAKNNRTHLARFALLDQVVFNGRRSGDTVLGLVSNQLLRLTGRAAKQTNPLKPQWVDLIRSPFLIFVVDFDAANGSDEELRGYLTGLWGEMSPELMEVFQHCYGFEAVKTADDFFRYIKKCQLETTMPFNDYWSAPPGLSDFPFTRYLIVAGLAALVAIAAPFFTGRWLSILAVAVILAVAIFGWKAFAAKAQAPFPSAPAPAPGSDLPTVLKALYLQRCFTDFAIRAQGMSDQDLYSAFGDFARLNRPDTAGGPTQQPGVIGV